MSGGRRWLLLAANVAAVVLAYFVVPVAGGLHAENLGRGVGTLLILVVLAVGVVRQLRLHLDDRNRRVDGLIVTIVVAMVVFAFSAYAIERGDPTQFDGLETRLDALYFTTATAATVGFGDVHAVGQGARALVLGQMVFNVVLLGTAVALLSSRVRAAASARAEARRPPTEPG
jgi:hypothetical protein